MSVTRALAIVLCAGLAGCTLDVDLGSGPYRCDKTGTCPDGQECNSDGLCVARQGPLPDGAPLTCGDQFCTETCSECSDDCGACVADELLHWSFDEDGPVVGDASKGGRAGSLETAGRIDSPRGRALAFDGSGGRAVRPSELDLVRPEVALSAWVRLPLAEEIRYDTLSGRDFVVGFHGDGGNFPMLGDIDDVRVLGRPLSATEIAELAAN